MAGGYNEHGSLNSFEIYDPTTKKWELKIFPKNESWHGSALVNVQNSKLVKIGGVLEGTGITNIIEEFTGICK